ncbi:hypothetical protein F5Y17DRAFT_436093 [Xylariaceae sp. FL0594]|nr:hypothetical protein F5Y17DRAFT_436093 [Xylariaceae sp. FL0594]
MALAAFRTSDQYNDLTNIANEHMKHDLEPSDRETLLRATRRATTAATVGSLVGLGLGLYSAIRLRKVRTEMFAAFRASEKPSYVVFPNGRQEAVPDITPLMRPTKLGDFATYFFFGLGGVMLGGEVGLFTGTWSASRIISKDPASQRRIESAYRLFRADILKREAALLEKGGPALKI